MSGIDDLFRDYRADVGRAPVDLVDRIGERVRDQRGRAAVLGRAHRRVPVLTGVAVAVVLVLAVALARFRPSPPAVPLAPTMPPARVAWGLDATVELVPDPGSTPQLVLEQMRQMIAQRAAATDAAGIEVTPIDATHVRIRMPGADEVDRGQEFVDAGQRIVILDAADRLAEADDLAGLSAAARSTLTPTGKRAYYVQERRRLGRLNPPRRFASRAAALREAATWRGPSSPVIVTAADTDILIDEFGGHDRDVLVRVRPLIPSAAVQTATVRRAGPRTAWTLGLDPARVPGGVAGRDVTLLTSLNPNPVPGSVRLIGRGEIDASGTRIVASGWDVMGVTDDAAHPDLAGSLRLLSRKSYGRRPPEPVVGRPFTPEPRVGSAPNGVEYRVAIDGTGSSGDGRLMLGYLRGAIVAVSAVGAEVTGEGATCPLRAGTPRVVRCVTGTGPMGADGSGTRYVVAGRASREAGRIAIRLGDGTTRDGVIRDGWFIAEVRVPRMPSDPEWPTILAWDRSGAPIPVSAR